MDKTEKLAAVIVIIILSLFLAGVSLLGWSFVQVVQWITSK